MQEFKTSKGAPHIMLRLIEIDRETVVPAVETYVTALGERGIRALAVARTDDQGRWALAGLLTFLDPPRPDTKITIECGPLHDEGGCPAVACVVLQPAGRLDTPPFITAGS